MADNDCKHNEQKKIGVNRGFEYAELTVCATCGLILDEKVITEED